MALPNALNSYYFPDSYDSLVDAFTGTIKYISASTGSNSNNGNSVGAAYLTIDYALAQNTSATPTMFVILAGTYSLTATSASGSSTGLTDGGNERHFVCAPGRVTIQYTASGGDRDSQIFYFTNTNTKIYGAILKRDNNGRTTNYTVAFFKGNASGTKGNFYNCVFAETNANNAWSYQYDNAGENNIGIRNCTFYNGAAPAGNYTNAGTCLTIDSVFNTTVTTGGTETNVLKSQTVNSTTYATTGVTTAGVYSGTYAWDGQTTGDPGITGPSTAVSGTTFNLIYTHNSSSDTVNYTITGVTSADINNASLTGSLTVTSYQSTLSITTKAKISTTNTLTLTVGSYTKSVTITPGMTARYLVVAGGGGGGSDMGGGGGAGGYLAGTGLGLSGNYTITIGAGGSGAPAGTSGPAGSNGQNTTALGLTAIGGGGGASKHDSNAYPAGNGGSGGGGSGGRQSGGSYGGLPGTGTLGQGNNGAASGVTWYPGGGGGAGAAASQTGSQQADGGVGVSNDILGTSYYWAAGGGGAGYTTYGGNGGLGGGGGGAPRQNSGTTNGTGGGSALNSGSVAEIGALSSQTNKKGGAAGTNTGSGGGGGSHYNATNDGGAGGSGITIIRYSGSQRATGGTITTVGSDTVHTFLTSGIFSPFSAGLNSALTSAYWSETITITYAEDVADGTTVGYAITGVTSEQISGASLTGNFTMSNSIGTLTINLATLSTAATATMVITAGAYTKTITITNIVSFTSNVAGTYWGGSIVFTILTKGLTSGGLIPYTISGVTSGQISGASLTGNATNTITSGTSGTSSITVTANSSEPVLNSVSMITSIPGGSKTNTIRTGNPRLSQSYTSSIQSLVFVDTEVTDIHSQGLEGKVKSLSSISATLETNSLSTAPSTMVFIDTETTDIHAQGLEAKVRTVSSINASLETNKLSTNMSNIVTTPTYAYSSGTEIAPQTQSANTISQIWTLS